MSGDLLLTDATVVTVGAHDTVLPGGAVAVRDGVIVAVGPTAEVAAAHGDLPVHDARGAIVHPGLVNAHAHLAMTLYRGVADDRDLQAFLATLLPAEAATLSADAVRAGVTLAVAESLRAGITAALDMYFWPEVAIDVAAATGFRIEAGPVFVSFPGPDERPFAERLAWADEMLADWSGGRWVHPHSTYLLTADELVAVRDLAVRHGARVHVHAAENEAEVAQVQAQHGGRRPVEVLDDLGLLGPGTTLAHAVALTDAEVDRLAATGAAVSHCPLSNLKLASGFCRVPDLLAAGVTVGLGTDGTASSNDLDLYLAMRTAAVVHKAHRGDAAVLPARAVLRMATMGSAAALGRAGDLGSIEVGKQADLVLLDPESPSLHPSFDPVGTIVYAAGRGDVRDVWVAGRPVVVDRRLRTVDVAAAIAAAEALVPEIARGIAAAGCI